MKPEAFLYLGITTFFVIVGTIYWFTSYEDAGSVMLATASLLGLLAGGFLLIHARRMEPRAEDQPDATLADGAGDVGSFPTPSRWPFVMAFAATVFGTGLVFGIWLLLGGGVLFAVALTGLVRESRGQRGWDEPVEPGSRGIPPSTPQGTLPLD